MVKVTDVCESTHWYPVVTVVKDNLHIRRHNPWSSTLLYIQNSSSSRRRGEGRGWAEGEQWKVGCSLHGAVAVSPLDACD